MSAKASQPQVSFGWETIHTAIDSLAYMVAPMKPMGIVAIARGGLVPATLLSHKLNLPLNVIKAASYDDDHTQKHEVELDIHEQVKQTVLANPARWLFVDDVLDSGHTYDAIKKVFQPVCMYAVIVTKRPLLHVAAFAAVPQGVWVKFPWEA
jgi:hypoxanthine phosphoribosyltransferase